MIMTPNDRYILRNLRRQAAERRRGLIRVLVGGIVLALSGLILPIDNLLVAFMMVVGLYLIGDGGAKIIRP